MLTMINRPLIKTTSSCLESLAGGQRDREREGERDRERVRKQSERGRRRRLAHRKKVTRKTNRPSFRITGREASVQQEKKKEKKKKQTTLAGRHTV